MDCTIFSSGLDVASWKMLCTSFRGASDTLCAGCSFYGNWLQHKQGLWDQQMSFVDPAGFAAFSACIALDKHLGVRSAL